MRNPTTNAGFIRKGLQLFRTEFKPDFRALCRLVHQIPGRYSLDGETVTIFTDRGEIVVAPVKTKPIRIKAQLSSESIIAVIDGEHTFEELLEREEFILFADSDAFLILNDALNLVIRSAIWSSVLQKHFDDYRQWVKRKTIKSKTTATF